MRKLTLADVKDLVEYEKIRGPFRQRIIDIKKRRRVSVGDKVSLVFENTETALSQVQEMTRAERIVDPAKIQFEIDTYNALIPDAGELSATLFIEITTADDLRAELDRLLGLDGQGVVSISLGDAGKVEGLFETGHSNERRISAVHYVKFRFTPAQRRAFIESPTAGRPIFLEISHPNYRHREELGAGVVAALAEDLSS